MAFDILFLNNMALDRYQLRQRRETLKRAFNPKQGYVEILPFEIGSKESDVDNKLRKVVMER
jgi:ATP-dependent DNA ligase